MAVPVMETTPTVEWSTEGVRLLDQTALPHEVRYQTITTAQAMVEAIQTMVVRGAPAIGVAGAFGVFLSAQAHAKVCSSDREAFDKAVMEDAATLAQSRPTAVNLEWAIRRMMQLFQKDTDALPETMVQRLQQEAQAILEEDLVMCHAIGDHGATVIPKGAGILTHCNAGGLATAGYGTALGVIRSAFTQDPAVHVYADETRPRLQGARLTTWELVQSGIPVTLITDNMSAWLMKQGKIDVVVTGADRVAANGDAANKIGTYLVALAAKAHQIPFYVAVPTSSIDMELPNGDAIPIEERDAAEVSTINHELICPEGVEFANPAFDVTPADLITGIITEKGIVKSPYVEGIRQLFL